MTKRPFHVTLVLVAMLWLFANSASATLHPQQGRFMQRDPLGYVDGSSLYEPLGSSPVSHVDAMGTDYDDRVIYGDREDMAAFRIRHGIPYGGMGLTSLGWWTFRGDDEMKEFQKNGKCCARVNRAKEIDVRVESFLLTREVFEKLFPADDYDRVKRHESKRRTVWRWAYDEYAKPVQGNGKLVKRCGTICSAVPGEAAAKLTRYLDDIRAEAASWYGEYATRQQRRITRENADRSEDVKLEKPDAFDPSTRCPE